MINLHRRKFPKFLLAILLMWLTNVSAWGLTTNSHGYYQISSAADLKELASVNADNIVADITANIDMGSSWTALAMKSKSLTIHGHGHTLSNFTCSSISDAGLVETVSSLSVDSLTITVRSVSASESAGAFAGYVYGTANFEYCYVKSASSSSQGNVIGFYAGSFVGRAGDKASFKCCGNYVSVSYYKENTTYRIGGFVGGDGYSEFYHCYNQGNVYGEYSNYSEHFAGGFAVAYQGGCRAEYCYNAGSVTCYRGNEKTSSAHPFFGRETQNTISNCYYKTYSGVSSYESQGTLTALSEFVNGNVCLKLNSDPNLKFNVWKQNLNSDNYPVTEADHNTVYKNANGKATNSTYGVTIEYTEDGINKFDGSYQPAEYVSGGYKISNPGQLAWFASKVNSGYTALSGYLGADIDCSNFSNLPIGTLNKPFGGVFDGKNHKISNFEIDDPYNSNVGLFGVIDNGTVRNLKLDKCHVVGGYNVGVLAGQVKGKSSITNCSISGGYYVSGDAKGNLYVGTLIGELVGGTVERCYGLNGFAKGNNYVGFIGAMTGSTALVRNCYDRPSSLWIPDVEKKFCGQLSAGKIEACYTTSTNGFKGDANCLDRFYYVGDGSGNTKTEAQFYNGDVTWHLNNGSDSEDVVWRQSTYPSYEGSIIHYGLICDGKTYKYHTYSDPTVHHYSNGYCTRCGAKLPAELNNGVYEISTVGQLDWFVQFVNSSTANQTAKAKLMDDIKLTSSWTPITKFKGDFDGNGHTITNLTINSESDNVGFIGCLDGNGSVHDLCLKNSKVSYTATSTNERACVGTIAGKTTANTLISKCSVVGPVYGGTCPNVGGVAGYCAGKIENCYFEGSVSGEQPGLIAGMLMGTVESCYSRYDGVLAPKAADKIINSYHFATSESSADVTGKTSAQLSSGEVTWLLNKGNETETAVWRQSNRPSLKEGSLVYKVIDCDGVSVAYNNVKANKEHVFKSGVCSHCGASEVAPTKNAGYYEISTAPELVWFAQFVNGSKNNRTANAKLVNDIKLDKDWIPIDDFQGEFDGNNKIISNLNITSSNFKIGFVGLLTGKIHDLSIYCNIQYTGTDKNCYIGAVAGIVGPPYVTTPISKCYVKGTIDAGKSAYAGCITGYLGKGTIQNSFTTATITGSNVGLIAGEIYSEIKSCFAYANGSLVAQVKDGGSITNSYYLTDAENASDAAAKTAEQFKSGEVCYLLNGERSAEDVAWHQDLTTYHYPTYWNDKVVYKHIACDEETVTYFNDPAKEGQASHKMYNGYCSVCKQYFEAAPQNETDQYYEISNMGQLFWFAQKVSADTSANYNARLMNDINIQSLEWTPIEYFKGTFDGQGHFISGMKVASKKDQDKIGFIGKLKSGSIKNLALKEGTITVGHNSVYAGAVAGYTDKGTTIEKCINYSVVYSETSSTSASSASCGGIVGSTLGKVVNCANYANCAVIFKRSGSIAAYAASNTTTIEYCYSYTTDTDNRLLCGTDTNNGAIKNSYYYGGNSTNNCYKTAEQFASGEVCWFLNGSSEEGVWKQKVGDKYPTFTSESVMHRGYICNSTTPIYYNDGIYWATSNHGHEKGENGYCKCCSAVMAPSLNADGCYEIKSEGDLEWYQDHADKDAIVMNDIKVSSSFKQKTVDLKATFDGNGHSIDYTSALLFNNIVSGAKVKNLTLKIHGKALCSTVAEGASIENCTINGASYLDAAFASSNDGTIVGCVNNAEVTASSTTACGAIVAINTGDIKDCVNNGNVLLKEPVQGKPHYVGGIVGVHGNLASAQLVNCKNTGRVVGGNLVTEFYVGGIAGSAEQVNSCVNEGWVVSQVTITNATSAQIANVKVYTGGIAGLLKVAMTNCVNKGKVEGQNYKDMTMTTPSVVSGGGKYTAGLVGFSRPLLSSVSIKDCSNEGEISGNSPAGLVGLGDSTYIQKSFNVGKVIASDGAPACLVNVGRQLWLTNCYSRSSIEGATVNKHALVYKLVSSSADSRVNSVTACYNATDYTKDVTNAMVYTGSGKYTRCATYGGNIGESNVTGYSFEDFQKGAVCYYLNNSDVNGTWRQILGKDDFPSFEGDAVIYTDGKYKNTGCTFVNGFCRCGKYEEPAYVDLKYQIANAGQLFWFADLVNNQHQTSKSAVLVADIYGDNDHIYTPIGTATYPYSGNFDGQYHVVSGLHSEEGYALAGMFGYLEGGLIFTNSDSYASNIRNLGVVNCNFPATSKSAAITPVASNYKFTNCYAYGNTANSGLIGYASKGTVKCVNCFADTTLIGSKNLSATTEYSNCFEQGSTKSLDGLVSDGLHCFIADKFQSGQVCYDINANDGVVENFLFQDLEVDSFPNFTNKEYVVYMNTNSCDNSGAFYANKHYDTEITHDYDSRGLCNKCGNAFEPAELVSGYYQIANLGNLYWFAQQVNAGNTNLNAKLVSDLSLIPNIRLASRLGTVKGFPTWTPIGTSDHKFSGKFNGNYHKINGANVGSTKTFLFGYCNGGFTKDLSASTPTLTNSNVIRNLGTINGLSIVSDADTMLIKNCYTIGCPIVGNYHTVASIEDCYTTSSSIAVKVVTSESLSQKVDPTSLPISNCYYNYEKNKESFNNGTYCANLKTSNHWRQTLGQDTVPSFVGDTVYAIYEHGATTATYANSTDDHHTVKYSNGNHESSIEEVDGHRICTVCHKDLGLYIPDEDGVLTIYNAEQLKAFCDGVNNGSYVQTSAKLLADIDLSSICSSKLGSWEPIGTATKPYKGTFNGAGFTVSGLYIAEATGNSGLFGTVTNATISGLTVEGMVQTGDNVAGIVGEVTGTTVIDNCVNKVDISLVGGVNVGGIAGKFDGSKLTNCSNYGLVQQIAATSSLTVGGIAGAGTIAEKCVNYGSVNGTTAKVGGIMGECSGSIYACANIGKVAGVSDNKNVAGLVGSFAAADKVTLTYSFNYGAVNNGEGTPIYGGTNQPEYINKNYYNNDASSESGAGNGFSAQLFADGLVAYYLSNGSSEWGQNLSEGGDIYPVLGGATVYGGYKHGEAVLTCSNTDGGFHAEGDENGSHNATMKCGEDGVYACSVCGYSLNITPVEGVYEIHNVAELVEFRSLVKINPSADAKLMDDIDLSSVCGEGVGSWEPIGSYTSATNSKPYKGIFDGNAKTISGLYIDGGVENQGLFGYISDATIKNLTIDGSVKNAVFAAGIVAKAYNSDISNCVNKASVSGARASGGIVGEFTTNNSNSISYCSNYGLIQQRQNNIGGIVGIVNDGKIDHCINYGNVNSYNAYAGGVAGQCYGSVSVTACANLGNIQGVLYVAGLVGKFDGSGNSITSCFNYGNVKAVSAAGFTKNIYGPIYALGTPNVVSECYYNSDAIYTGTANEDNSHELAKEEFANGVVAYLLNARSTTNPVWGQTIGTDSVPVLGGATVYGGYRHGEGTLSCSNTNVGFHAEPEEDGNHDASVACNANGELVCSVCGYTKGLDKDGDIYLIHNAKELVAFRTIVKTTPTANAKLMDNIDLSSVCGESNGSWEPIGTSKTAYYSGTFDGNGKTVSGLYINATTECQGLFGYLKNASISNTTVKGLVNSTNALVGGIAGGAFGNTSITGCVNEAEVTSKGNNIGGIVGYADTTLIEISDCVNNGNISGYQSVGGIVSVSGSKTQLSRNINNGNVTATTLWHAGGIVGLGNGCSIIDCANFKTITGAQYVGGIVGSTTGSITNCYNLGDIKTKRFTNVGAIYGTATGATVTNCYYLSSATYDYNVNSKNATAASSADFASGKVTYGLNAGITTNPVWGQNLTEGGDVYPVLGGATVYGGYKHGETEISTYANSAEVIHTTADVDGSHDAYFSCDGETGVISCSICGAVHEFAPVEGTYIIHNAAELVAFRVKVKSTPNADAQLANNIDLSNVCNINGKSWEPIGSLAIPYAGTFDGNGDTISGLYVNTPEESNVGLFGVLKTATIKNLTVDGSVTGAGSVGGIAGNANADSNKPNGVIDYASSFENCVNLSSVTTTNSTSKDLGGIAGYARYSTFNNCTNRGIVNSNTTTNRMGGIAGYGKDFTKCLNFGDISISGNNVGGIVGNCAGNVSYSGNAGNVIGATNTGGLVGYITSKNKISYSYNYGKVLVSSNDSLTAGPLHGTCKPDAASIKTCCYNSESDYTHVANVGGAKPISVSDFSEGAATYFLNNGEVSAFAAWRQTIGKDSYPVFSGDIVNMVSANGHNSYSNSDFYNLFFSESQSVAKSDSAIIDTVVYVRKVSLTVNTESGEQKVNGKWGTLCLPFEYEATDCNATLFQVESVSDAGISLVQVSGTVPAGKPLVYYHTKTDSLKVTAYYVTEFITNPAKYGVMQGTLKCVTVSGEDVSNYYYLKDNQFYKGNGSYTLNPYRAHMYVGEGSAMKSLRIITPEMVDEENVVEDATEDATKEVTVEGTYNVSGQRVNDVRKNGIYILKMSDGTSRKVVIK